MAISERRKETLKAWRVKNRQKLIDYYCTYRRDNHQSVLEYGRKYRSQHSEATSEYNRAYKPAYRKKNKERIAMAEKSRRRNRYQHDIKYRLLQNCRNRLGKALRHQGSHKLASTAELIGCDINHLKSHLESLFTQGMSWDNHGYGHDKWHIDHIMPCVAFDLSNEEQQKKCFHWTNLQPLWHEDNLKKSDHIPANLPVNPKSKATMMSTTICHAVY